MFYLNTGANTIELKAKAASYRKLKQITETENLRAAFTKAYNNLDIDFLCHVLDCFVANNEQYLKLGKADGVIDECMDNGINIMKIYADVAEFINGMGFFGDLGLSEGQTAIEWFADPMNGIDLDSKLANAMNNGLDAAVAEKVKEMIRNQ